MNCISDFFTYETTKSVVVKSWTIGIINRVVQLLIISYFVGWVFLHEKAYQVRDTAIESSVVTKVKGFGLYANRVMDVSDYVTPPQVWSPTQRGMRMPSEEKYRCVSDSQCRPERFPGGGILTGRCVNYSSVFRTCEIQGWCPTEVDTVEMPIMMEAENFTIFIKNSIRFPLFNFEKGNLLPNLTARDMKTCRFHPDKDPFCPILRVGDVVKFAGQDFAKLARTGGVLGIKIGWVCDLDKAWDQCIPKYSFTRLDSVSEKSSVSPGYNFRFAKYYKMENGSEYRTLLKAFGIRFDVLVYGNAGKFNIIPTIISSVAAFTSVGVGTVLCDIILLNFLKGADQYKAKKFEEVNETTLKIAALTNPVYPSDQTTAEKQSTDSGAFSIGH
uniref:P2X purinoceptor n=1 Tax=Mandrillus leucophaeus TaxID=9568 RepID=A0A2K6A1M3_MANLE